MITIREYIDLDGRSPYAKWFNRLNAPAAAKVAIALVRMEQGNFSNPKGIGEGVFECRIDFGPGAPKEHFIEKIFNILGKFCISVSVKYENSWVIVGTISVLTGILVGFGVKGSLIPVLFIVLGIVYLISAFSKKAKKL